MSQIRFKAAPGCAAAYYHCTSRAAFKNLILEEHEKARFLKIMRLYERFCRVQVITFCLMKNHIHLLLAVPRRPDPQNLPSDSELVNSVRELSGCLAADILAQQLSQLRTAVAAAKPGAHEALNQLRERFLRRMWDVSWFMRLLKQRFSRWYNLAHNNKGTLWEDRFHSVIVEGSGCALSTIAAYIDLNPVRARLEKEPGTYRWCGYSEALSGQKLARRGLAVVACALNNGQPVAGGEVLPMYRQLLFEKGREVKASADGLVPARPGIPEERVEEVVKAKGKMSVGELVRCYVRYFHDGIALGCTEFVDEIYHRNRDRFGPRRKSGARTLKGVDAGELRTLRDFRNGVIPPADTPPS